MGAVVRKLVFQPPNPPSYDNSEDLIWLRNQPHHAAIPVVHVRGHGRMPRFTLIFSHGNGEDLGQIREWMTELAKALEVDVVAFDYTGYGRAEGADPSEHACYENIRNVFHYVRNVENVPSEKIVLYGRSLGTGVTVDLAAEEDVRGVILQSPLLSAYRVLHDFRWTLPGDMFCTIHKIGQIRARVFFIHGKEDDVVPFWHGVRLHNQCRKGGDEPWWVDGAGHNDIETRYKDELLRRLDAFLTSLT